MSIESDDAEVLRTIKLVGMTCRYRLCYQTGIKSGLVSAAVDRLLARGQIIELGLASDLGIEKVRGNVMMLGLPGAQKVEKKTKGSGVIAGRRTIPAYVFPSKFRGTW